MQEVFVKIKERLKVQIKEITKWDSNKHYIYQDGVDWMGDKAIEIVNQVAEEYNNDVCEWVSSGISDEWKPSCEPNSTYNVFGVAWFKYCPYCGKRMKVVRHE